MPSRGAAAEGLDEAVVAGRIGLDPLDGARMFTVWQMKDRAGAVGELGVAPLLTELSRSGARIHCVGHSYGAKVMLSAICAAELDRPVRSVLLLQPAISHLCFADVVPGVGRPGGYREALNHIELPVLSTFSSHDQPLTIFYQRALRRARCVAAEPASPAGRTAIRGTGN